MTASLTESLKELLDKAPAAIENKPRYTREEWERRRTEALNEAPGGLHLRDGIDCPQCANKGYIYRLTEDGTVARPCECLRRRKVMRRMEASGLGQLLRDCTFDRFIAKEDWQKRLKELALRFCEDDNANWFYVGGQPGSGKTHLCTAICERYIRKGRDVRYLMWAEKSKLLKAAVGDYRAYAAMLDEYKRIPVLYIDDFLKVRQGAEPSDGDLNLAFELINARLLLPDGVTVISSEKTAEEAMTYDEATVSRIVQQCGPYRIDLERDREKNYRLRQHAAPAP